MPIVIMKRDSSPVTLDWVRPHAVFEGTMKQAKEWCKKKNDHPNNLRTTYEAVSVKTESVGE